MSKPVEIEFLMKDNLSGGLDKAGLSVQALADRAKAASELINSKITEQRKVIDGVSSDLDRMERQLAGMKPGTAQRELAADVAACRKVLDEERGALAELEKQHRQAESAVNDLAKEQENLSTSGEKATAAQMSLADRIAESKNLIKGTQADIKELEKAYKNAAPGNARSAVYAELNAAKKALEDEKTILASLTAEQERNRESNKRLSLQLRELQDAMARMRLEGRQDSEEYRKMAAEAANLSDTIADLRTQTKILSNDDANLQGFMSGVSGLSGMFTAATGAMSLFVGENENLAKIQTRVQSVMAVTMGLQQVFNTLNKDSAFRLVTVTKAKNLLTAANTRLAASLGISTVAAQALMATLTLGLSAVITGLIVLWNKYSDAQDEAARKAQEKVEIESEGRAQMIKTRFEIDNTLTSLKNFTGSKEEEKKKTEELNRKYGEAFGYYDTVAEWYDILKQKSADYIQMLFLQAKVQAMVNKAIEADEKLNKIKATGQDDVEGSMDWFAKWGLYLAQGETGGRIDARAEIDAYNKAAKEKAVEDAQAEIDGYIKQAEELIRQAAQIGKNSNIGGHTKPDTPKPTGKNSDKQKEHERKMAAERQRMTELLALRRENDAAEIEVMDEGLQKKLRQIDNEYQARKNEIDKQESEWKRKNKESGNDESLSDEQQSAIDKARELNEERRKREEKEAYDEELAFMREHLKQYGSFEQQKLAITEEYVEKIRKARSKGERLSLEKEMRQTLSGLSYESISAGIDWKALFSGVSTLSKEMLQPMADKLQAYSRTDEYKNADTQTQQQVAELIQELRKYVGTDQSVTWQTLANAMADFTASVDAYNKARTSEDEAVAERDKAKKRLDAGEITEAEYIQAEDNVMRMGDAAARAREDMEGFGTVLNNTSELVANFTSGLTVALSNAKAWAGVGGFSGLQQSVGGIDAFKGALDSVLPSMSDGMAKTVTAGLSSSVGSGLSSLDSGLSGILTSGLGQVVGFVAQIPRLILDLVSGIKSFVTGILDSFVELISLQWIEDLVNSILDSVGNLVDAIFDLPENLFDVLSSIVVDGVGGLLDNVLGRVGNILSFGLLDSGGPSEWFTNSNAKEVQEAISRLTARNEQLQTAIEDLTDEMKSGKGTKSVAAYKDAYKYQDEANANYLRMAQEQSGYHGNHHSWGYYWDGFTKEQIERLSSQIGRQWDGDLWNLSPEEMKLLRSNVDMWDRIKNTGKGSYGDSVADKLDDYIEQAGKLEELTNQLYEGLTGISFDGLYGSFIDNLMDMKYDAKVAAEDISEYFMHAMLSNKIGEMYSDKLKDWWERFGKAMEDNDLTEAERKALADEYMAYVDEAIKLRDNIAAATGYDQTGNSGTSQSARAGGFAAMTQDQGTKLEGMFTGGLQHWSSMDERLEDVAGKMDSAEDHLARIEENTGKSAGHLEAIAENILKIIRDGLKVR